ncbi:HlyD family efflux transporter periplasmic adaptor subunit [Alteromonas ponticola]|uniref:HlyD family efflux transporter periplasmic adaptor subunit n=1 Tax=Alteromonas aquimaris TaxID=2998417 RepID=A0ABT3PB29_9ALTE|nr:HlyD family efflux transporter periplasmic adaptor subunit [Alteromonas aquimaris]MCW8109276.1 HlyD family efflux transporter periplasmic adaptor subunit [Alteromonas aquimaris]
MRKGLFRQEAIESQRQKLDGNVILLPHFSALLVTFFVFIWVGISAYFLFTHDYAQQAQVSGWLEPAQGLVRVYPHRGGGRITMLNVKEGQHVTAGQTLLTIDNRAVTLDGSLEQKLITEYHAQQKTLNNQLTVLQTHYQTEQRALRLSMQNTQQRLANLDGTKKLVVERLDLARSHYDSAVSLVEKELLSYQEAQRIRASYLALQQDVSQWDAETLQLSNTLEDQKLAFQQLTLQFEQNNNDVKVALSELNQRIATTHSQQTEVIKAPKAGIVSNLLAFEGEFSQPQKPLLTLLPPDASITAKLIVPVRAAGFVKAGQLIDLRYDAFPFQKFGVYTGRVIDIAQSVSLPGELQAVPVAFNEPVYVVNATVESNFIQAYGVNVPLKAGMTFSAHVEVSKRSLIEWLFEPLFSLAGRV